jgi:hypothetical protein
VGGLIFGTAWTTIAILVAPRLQLAAKA